MIKPEFREALIVIANVLQSKNIRGVLVGSMNMAVQGIDVHPNDIDIIVGASQIPLLERALSAYIVSPSKRVSSGQSSDVYHELLLKIKGVQVQLMGEYADGRYYSRCQPENLKMANIGGSKIACLSLQTEAEIYGETRRDHKRKIIIDFLNRQNKA